MTTDQPPVREAHPLEFLTNEPVEGERLSSRLMEGALPPEEALRIALDVGTALQHAHSLGKVHGRISPGAVVVAGSGARLLQPRTVSRAAAEPYFSPEQVRGDAADWRSDIFSYGSLLYELVSGHAPFAGTREEIAEAIEERPAAALLAKIPIHAALEGVVAGCLQKDPGARRQRIQNALIELRLTVHSAARPAEPGTPTAARPNGAAAEKLRGGEPADKTRPVADLLAELRRTRAPAPRRRRTLAIALTAGFVLMALAGAAFATMYLGRDRASPQVLRFSVPPPQPAGYCGAPAISPDGRFLACAAPGRNGQEVLWIRGFDETDWSAVEDSDGAFAPFWSADSRYVGFFARGLVKRAAPADEGGRTARALFEAHGNGGGAAWNREGRILFAPDLESGLLVAPMDGGKPRPFLSLRKERDETAYLWPQFLPDGKHFIFYVQTKRAETSGIAAGSLDSAEWKFLFPCDSNAVYAPPSAAQSKTGYLLYIRDGKLQARDFNAGILDAGSTVPGEDAIGTAASFAPAPFSVSRNGTLVYEEMVDPTRQPQWLDRGGKRLRNVSEPGLWGTPRVSPDGRQAALTRLGTDAASSGLWLISQDGTARLLPPTAGESAAMPVWSPDGSRLAYSSSRNGVYDLLVRDVGRGSEEPLYESAAAKYPTDWTADGRYLLFGVMGEGTGSDIWALSMNDKKAAPIIRTIHAEEFAAVSPDGKWVAYESDETGRSEIYVQPFDPSSTGTRRRVRVSADGGEVPYWTRHGCELIYMTGSGHVMAAAVRPKDGVFDCDTPQVLFQVWPMPSLTSLYSVSPDGERFLVMTPVERTSPTNGGGIKVVTNWTELRKLK